jgi:hypothetical protein
VPLSSTVAETFEGVAIFYLITSSAHHGPYEVIVSTGGGGAVSGQRLGGLFSTPVQSARAGVTCSAASGGLPPAPSPATVSAPPGPGITPPGTGEAGLR